MKKSLSSTQPSSKKWWYIFIAVVIVVLLAIILLSWLGRNVSFSPPVNSICIEGDGGINAAKSYPTISDTFAINAFGDRTVKSLVNVYNIAVGGITPTTISTLVVNNKYYYGLAAGREYSIDGNRVLYVKSISYSPSVYNRSAEFAIGINNTDSGYISYTKTTINDLCNATSPYLAESYCSAGVSKRVDIFCQYGCSNGACNPTPPVQSFCNDSDGDGYAGINYYVKGTTNSNKGVLTDYCYDGYNTTHLASGPYLKEYYCLSGALLETTQECNCVDGACVQQNQTTCTDTDGGINVTQYGESIINSQSWCREVCYANRSDAGGLLPPNSTVQFPAVMECFCNSSSVNGYSINFNYCPFGCSNGACSTSPPACTPSWNCTGWSTCFNNTQTRTCTDLNNCGDISTRPALSQSCTLPGLPDLTVTALAVEKQNYTGGNYTFVIAATVKNIGNADAGSSNTLINVVPIDGGTYVSTPALRIGELAIVRATRSAPAGSWTARAWADAGQTIVESNENNNELRSGFVVP